MTMHLQAEFIYKYLHMFLECISFKTEIPMVRWNTRIRRKITLLGNSWAWTMVIPAKTSGVVFLFPYVLWMWLWHLWAWWSRTEDNWCWIEEPYFLLWQLAIFVTLWLSWTQSKYSHWSPPLPGWVSRWWNTLSTSLDMSKRVGFGYCFCLKWCCVWVVARSFEVLLGVSFLPQSCHVLKHDRLGKILFRLSLACLHWVIFVWIQWGFFVCLF